MTGVYVHIPFCRSKWSYNDFFFPSYKERSFSSINILAKQVKNLNYKIKQRGNFIVGN